MHLREVLKRPILTEKSSYLTESLHRYVFEVDRRATKQLVREAVQSIFGVTVVDVNMMSVRGKQRRVGRFTGKTPDWKKAIVVLAAGESISFFEGV